RDRAGATAQRRVGVGHQCHERGAVGRLVQLPAPLRLHRPAPAGPLELRRRTGPDPPDRPGCAPVHVGEDHPKTRRNWMLVLQEIHRVKGAAVEEFESITQQFWKAAAPLGATPAWFFEVSHGTGPSYCVITGLRLPGWSAWEAFARAVAYGELSTVSEELDATRYDSESSVLEVLSEEPPAAAASP